MRTSGILIAVCGLVTFVQGSNGFLQVDAVDSMFARFMARYGKSYSTKEEYNLRKALFEKQLEVIALSNARNGASYTVGLNQFSDLTDQEFSRYLGDSGAPEEVPEPALDGNFGDVQPIDWRNYGVVGPVKDQGHCGSCWSFSTIGPIEEHYAIKYNASVVLSEQQLVDCSTPYGNNGCNGGLFANGYAYVQQYGAQSSDSYPYTASDDFCAYNDTAVQVRITGTISAIRSASGLKAALQNGPASISLYASDPDFRAYKTGIYDNAACPTSVNHAVQTVGWGKDAASGKNYFIVRNSWGASWGDQGYIKIAESTTALGICGMLYRVPMQPIIE